MVEESPDQHRGGSMSDVSTPTMKRHGSRLSYGSNDSGGSGSSSGPQNKVRFVGFECIFVSFKM